MSEPARGPGTDLKAAREALKVSVREVADALNLPVRVIEALEADDYQGLTPSVFTRGYLRSYARLLELPVDELLARYPEVTQEVDVVSEERTRTGTHAVITGPRRLGGPIVVAVVVLAALIAWLLMGDGFSGRDAGGRDPVVAPAQPRDAVPARDRPEPVPVIPEPTEADSTAGRVDDVPAPAETATVDAGAADEPEAAARTGAELAAPRAAGDDPAGVPVLESDVQERRITDLGDDRLAFTFSEDCWVEVKTVDGENLYSDLNRAGRTLILTGRAPFRVLLGYAPGVSLEFNGEPVVLSRYARNNVASLVLGQ